jgi:Membrane protein involved in the export of O-antigen and teichoic acid
MLKTTETHTDIFHTLFKRASYAFSGTLVGKVSAALAGIIIARSLGVALFGTYSAIWELVLLCASITETGLTIGIQRDGAGDRKRLPELVGNALFMRMVIGAVALVIAYFFSSKISRNPLAPVIYLFLSVASLVIILSEPLFSGMLALGRQKTVAKFESVRGILLLLGIAILMVLKRGVISVVLFQAFLYLATLIVLFYISHRHFALSLNFSSMWHAFRTSFIYGVSSQLYSIYSRVPIVLLALLTTDKQVGYFTAAMRVVGLVQVVGGGIYSRAFVPTLFEYMKISREKFIAASGFMFAYFTLLGALVGISFFVLAEPIILVLMGGQYHDSILVLRILSFALFLIFANFAPDAAMTAGNKNVKKVMFQIIGPVAGLLTGPFLVTRYQAAGAAYTEIVIMTILLILFSVYSIKENFVNLRIFGQIRFPVIAIGLCGALSLALFGHSIIPLILVFCCSSGVIFWFWMKRNQSFLVAHN